jgi:hypothetical protein
MLEISSVGLHMDKVLFSLSGSIVALFLIVGLISNYSNDVDASINNDNNTIQNPISKDGNKEFFVVDIFTDEGFTGINAKINKNTPLLQEPFHDSISSVKITPGQNFTNGYMVELCEHKSYAGQCTILGPGNYNADSLALLHDKIDSIRFLSPSTLKLKGLP